MKKSVFVGILYAAVVAACCVGFVINKNTNSSPSPSSIAVQDNPPVQKVSNVSPKKPEVKEDIQAEPVLPKEVIKYGDMYSSLSNNQLPLSGISVLVDLPEEAREEVENVIESSKNIFMLKRIDKEILLLVENPSDSRHNLDLKEISLKNVVVKNLPFSSHIAGDETERDIWEYEDNDDTKRPVKHIKYDDESNIEYTEFWNYSSDEPVKYEIRDGEDRVISIKKETIDNETSLREEHIFYNKDGSTNRSVSITYSGPDIIRFTYYNSENPNEGISIFSNYGEDGSKIKETVYTPDFKVVNVYEAMYKDGVRTGIKVFDKENREVEKILSK